MPIDGVRNWQRVKADPVLLEQKRARARADSRRLYERRNPGCADYVPGLRGPRRRPDAVARRKAGVKARRYEQTIRNHRARWLFLANQVPGCLEPRKCKDCKRYMHPDRIRLSDRRCCECSRAKRARDRERMLREEPERYRALKKVAKHRRRAAERGAGGAFTADAWRRVLERFRNECAHCGTSAELTVDHVIPLSRGGSNDWTNLQPLCHPCNSVKCNVMTGAVQAFIPGMVAG